MEYVTLSENMTFPANRPIPWIANLSEAGLNNFYSIHWNMPKPFDPAAANEVGHPPHMHKENELMFLIGMDPEDPNALGAEVEICIGAEMKKYTITRSGCIFIPANTPHGFYRVVRAEKPWMFVQVQEANPRTEKFLWEYLTPEQIASIPERAMQLWVDTGYDED